MVRFYSFPSLWQVYNINLCPRIYSTAPHCLKSILCYPAIYIEVSYVVFILHVIRNNIFITCDFWCAISDPNYPPWLYRLRNISWIPYYDDPYGAVFSSPLFLPLPQPQIFSFTACFPTLSFCVFLLGRERTSFPTTNKSENYTRLI